MSQDSKNHQSDRDTQPSKADRIIGQINESKIPDYKYTPLPPPPPPPSKDDKK